MQTKKIKPSAINSLIPELLKNLFRSFIYVTPLFIANHLLKNYNLYPAINLKYFYILFVTFALIPTLIKAFVLKFTTYYFFDDHITSEFKFITIKRHSVPYNKITNISTDISIWDRITNAGDVILHTAEDSRSDLTLKYINNINELEKEIYKLIKKQNN